jgi:hypothetical protein
MIASCATPWRLQIKGAMARFDILEVDASEEYVAHQQAGCPT